MRLLSHTAQIGLAAVFLWAALAKAQAPRGIRYAIAQLGGPARLAAPAAAALIGVELGTALGLLVAPSSPWPRLAVALLGVLFAAAGLHAIATGRQITCRCLGNAGSGVLGWRQVWLLPAWLGLAALAQWQPPAWPWQNGFAILALLLLGLIAWRLPTDLRALRKVQRDRRRAG